VVSTDTDVIPVFPLGTVLLPGDPLPLHIFEPRYRQLLADVTSGPAARRAFGVVALQRGVEARQTANTVLADVGTLAEILDSRLHPDGSSDLLTVGSRRFRISTVDETPAGYLRATVEWLSERDGDIRAGDVAAAREQVGFYRRTLAALAGADPQDEQALPSDPVALSYALSARLVLAVPDRQRLLAAETAADRIRAAMALLRRETVLLRETRSIPAPLQTFRFLPAHN
jgi:Lon protease-like protein